MAYSRWLSVPTSQLFTVGEKRASTCMPLVAWLPIMSLIVESGVSFFEEEAFDQQLPLAEGCYYTTVDDLLQISESPLFS